MLTPVLLCKLCRELTICLGEAVVFFTLTLLLITTVGLGVGLGVTVGIGREFTGLEGITGVPPNPGIPVPCCGGTTGVLGKSAGLGMVLGTVPGRAALPPIDKTAPIPVSRARPLIAVAAAVAVVATAVFDVATAPFEATTAAFLATTAAVIVL